MKTYTLHPEAVRNRSESIASTYDFLDHFSSPGRDFYWRRAVQERKGRGGFFQPRIQRDAPSLPFRDRTFEASLMASHPSMGGVTSLIPGMEPHGQSPWSSA
jgi:hypothetical protein